MNGYTHMIVGGLSAGLVAMFSISARKFGFEINEHFIYPLIGIIPAVVGGLSPDIDMPDSKSGRWLRKVLTIVISGSGIILSGLTAVILITRRNVSSLLPFFIFFIASCLLMTFIKIAKHRRETHSGVLMLVLLLPTFWIIFFVETNLLVDFILSLWTGFCIGWFSHLVADSFNKKGVPWLFPFSKKHYHIANIVTGTSQENLFRMFSIGFFSICYLLILLIGRI